ncbi:aminotransferase class III-fold pyridoxal phosphate-dependent enzyme [Streptosporangium sp. NPDC000396]|uniref:aminotransferase class III-fold pyridoxal phosphate-dependent enzyme n=1 Tax=Streptosporangium sp. NPDC000396 TaxID=3366185 RepID=UPI003687B65E
MTSVCGPADSVTLKAIAQFTEERRANMILTNAFISAEGAKLGYMLSRLLGGTERFYTFFANSTLEGLSGAVKLARHTSVRRKRADSGRVLLVDPEDRYAPFFDPVGAGTEGALAPCVHSTPDIPAALDLLRDGQWSAVVLVRTSTGGREDGRELFDLAAERGSLRVLCNTELDLWEPEFFTGGPEADVHVFGENLTGRQVPFGCFTMSAEAYSVWNNARDSLAHTSTFGGNGLCLSLVLDALHRHGHVNEADEERLRLIDTDMRARIDTFRDHVNPITAQGMEMSGFALDITEASGARLRLADGSEVIDCAGCGGVNLRGHNPQDIVAEVLAEHDPDHDYFADLESHLGGLTRFEHAFPAVSGATAVDVAVSLALMAGSPRTKVLTFDGNFSGKTLISMNLSKYGQQHIESDREAFRPYYFDLVYVDPFAADARKRLERELRKNDIALVWLEVTRGLLCEALPEDLLVLISELKDECGYLIGVDEVVTGVWRTGDAFLAHDRVLPNSDIATLAKPLSDTTLPMGAALVTREVHDRALKANPDHLERLRRHYRNGLTAHIALHALERVEDPEVQAERERSQALLNEGLAEIAAQSKLFDFAAGRGSHMRLMLRRRWFPFNRRSQLGQLLEAALSAMIMRDCGVLVLQLRFFPRIFSREEDVRAIVARLKSGTRGYTPLSVYRFAAWQVLTYALAQIKEGRREKSRRRQTGL